MAFYILTVQALNNGNFRFGLSTKDSKEIRSKLKGKKLYVELPKINETICIAEDTFNNHGNLFHTAISKWIIDNGYSTWEVGKPYKLLFEFSQNILSFYPNQAH